jgi:fibrillarin-like pre-rRNA processing protein
MNHAKVVEAGSPSNSHGRDEIMDPVEISLNDLPSADSTPGRTMTPGRLIRRGRKIFTISQIDGKRRYWDPNHSKLAALMLKRSSFALPGSTNILYLGGGHGTTVSHLADLFPEGGISVIEFGITMDGVLELARERPNIFPIMEDARIPDRYDRFLSVRGGIDLLYQDVAQPHQLEILVNHFRYLRPGGMFILMVKIRSISQSEDKMVYGKQLLETLSIRDDVKDIRLVDLAPYQRDHIAIFGNFN